MTKLAEGNMRKLAVGKLDSDMLEKIVLERIQYRRPEVKIRAGIGEDCAVMDFGAYDCVVSTDPITASVKEIGKLAIHISCNDVASNGIQPVGITLAVMLPEGTTEEDVATIMDQAAKAAEEAEVEIIGGHTEVTTAVNQPVIVSTAIGRAMSSESSDAKDMKAGDLILLTKNAGLEGTGIIATDCREILKEVLTEEELAEATSMLERVSVVKDGVIAGKIGTSGMHDVTEGGIYGAVWEMCRLSGKGALIDEASIFVDPVTEKICKHFRIDPLRLISSGCMLIAAPKEKAEKIMEKYSIENIRVSAIGEVKPEDEGVKVLGKDGAVTDIMPPEADELYKVI